MTAKTSRWTGLGGVILVALGVLVAAQACGVDGPFGPEAEPEPELAAVPNAATDISAEPTFTPYTVAPDILNRAEVVQAMTREYPALLRNAGIGGTVTVYFFIDEDGVVEQFQIQESSGHQALDDAALAVAGVYRFSPALNRDKKVPVWVSFGITFQTR